MKSWTLLFLHLILVSCTSKYVDYDVIHKLSFRQNAQARPVAPIMAKGPSDQLEQCFNQWLFFSNAEKQKEAYIPDMVQVLCPGSDWLLDSRLTTSWWTTIFFSRACAKLTTHCPAKRLR